MLYSPHMQTLGDSMYQRLLEHRADEALLDTPVVAIVEPRRAGKTTLARKLADAGRT